MASTSTTVITTITTLPTEIIVDIFSHLDYLTLHTKIRPVCTFFNNVITSTTSGPLGIKLLRAKETDKNEYCFEFHPCICKLVINLGLITSSTTATAATATAAAAAAHQQATNIDIDGDGGSYGTGSIIYSGHSVADTVINPDRPSDIDPKIHIGFINPSTHLFSSIYNTPLWNEYVLLPAVSARDFLIAETSPSHPHHYDYHHDNPSEATPFLLSNLSSKAAMPTTVGEFVMLLMDEAGGNYRHWRIRNKWEVYYSGRRSVRGLIEYRRIMGWVGSEVYGDKFCECFGTDVFAGMGVGGGGAGSGSGGSAAGGGRLGMNPERCKSGDRIVYQMGRLSAMLSKTKF